MRAGPRYSYIGVSVVLVRLPDRSGMNREIHVPFYEGLEVKLLRSTLRSELGAEHVGLIQSLFSTCRLHDIHLYTYLVDVLQRVSIHPASRVHELTPRLWKEHFVDDPLRSDIYDSG
jgi:hypothetical protein